MAELRYRDIKIDGNLVNVNINQSGDCNLGEGNFWLGENNKTFKFYPSNEGLDGYNEITIQVDVPQSGGGESGGDCNLEDRNFWLNENNIYTFNPKDEGLDGYNEITITVDVPQSGGESVGEIDFSQIGYVDELPTGLNSEEIDKYNQVSKDFAYSKQKYDEWDSSNTDASNLYANDTELVYCPNIDTSNVASAYRMFYSCTNMKYMPSLNFSNVTNMSNTFDRTSGIEVIPPIDTSNASNWNSTFAGCTNLKRIEGIDLKSATNLSTYSLIGFTKNTTMRYMLIRNIGYQDSCNKIYCNAFDVWGIDSDEVPDARQSLINSLITYSFDRAANGYSICTITLSSNSKEVLSEEEITQIEAKGYQIM